MRLASLED